MQVREHLGLSRSPLPQSALQMQKATVVLGLSSLPYAGWPLSRARTGRTLDLEDNPACGEFFAPPTTPS